MPDQSAKSLDIFGLKPVSKSIEKATEALVKGAQSFFGRICNPGAEELGLLIKDQVASWRANNAARIALKAEKLVKEKHADEEVKVHPRIVHSVIELGSWSDDEVIQNMWAGLLASSCTTEDPDVSATIYINLLNQLTPQQVKVINLSVERSIEQELNAPVCLAPLVLTDITELKSLYSSDDEARIRNELEYLVSLRLIGNPFNDLGPAPPLGPINITPQPLAKELYRRANS